MKQQNSHNIATSNIRLENIMDLIFYGNNFNVSWLEKLDFSKRNIRSKSVYFHSQGKQHNLCMII